MAEREEVPANAEKEVEPVLIKAPLEAPKDPYEKSIVDSITKFFRNRSKNPRKYTFTENGNLQITEPEGTIQLMRFMPLEPSERAALEEYRLETISELQEKYETEKIALNEAWDKYRNTGEGMRDVIAANQRVAGVDIILSNARSAIRNIVPIVNPTVKEIILSQRYEDRKLFGSNKDPWEKEVMRLCFYDFKAEHDQGKYVLDKDEDAAAASAAAEAEGGEPSELMYRQKLKDGRKARIFFESSQDVNGFLSPTWQARFTMDETEYSSAIQAYEAERAKELGMADLRASLLKTNSTRTIRLMTRKIKEHPADAKGLWLKIFTQLYQQTDALKERLLATGTDTLVYADIREGPSGVGLDEKDSGVLDPTKWKGENAVGLALETVRTQMREGNLKESPANNNPNERAITEEEQDKARVGAIIANARRNRG